MSSFESILSAASELPVPDRLRLIDALASSVPDDSPPSLSPEWLAEIERRAGEVDSSGCVPIPWDQVLRDLFKKVG